MGYQFKNKIHFVTIGYIEWRKGQDVLIEAFSLIPDELKEKCELLLVGQDSSAMAQELKVRIEKMPQISMCGKVDREKIKEILQDTDVMICPSREDPMPTVAAEAMAFGKPCILSDSTGTAGYIVDGENGFVFENEKVEHLTEKIIWCINNVDKIGEIGEKAKKTFDKTFSAKVFVDNFLSCVKEMIGDA